MKSTNALRITLGLVAVVIAWMGFQLGSHRHTGLLRALAEAKHFIQARHFASDPSTHPSTYSNVQQRGANMPPGTQHTVTLSWRASTSAVIGYNVYRRDLSGVVKLNSEPVTATSYVDRTVSSGQTYSYVTKAVNAKGTESAPSNEARADVPTP